MADAYAMIKAFRAGKKLSKEIKKLGGGQIKGNELLKADAFEHLAEQEDICLKLDTAMGDCITRQRALNDKRRKWIDTQLDALKP
jgi:hypothetical protein